MVTSVQLAKPKSEKEVANLLCKFLHQDLFINNIAERGFGGPGSYTRFIEKSVVLFDKIPVEYSKAHPAETDKAD